MDQIMPTDDVWYPEDRVELRDWLLPEVQSVADRYRIYTGAGVHRVEVVIVDERGDSKQINFNLNTRHAD